MGTLVKAPTFDAEKNDYQYLEGTTLTVEVGEVVFWVGDEFIVPFEHAIIYAQSMTYIRNLNEELKQAGYPTPGAGNVTKAVLTYPDAIVVTADATLVVPAETEIAVLYGESAQLADGDSISRQLNNCIQKYFEEYPKYRQRRAG